MASPDVVAPALLLPIPVISLLLSLYNFRSSLKKFTILVFLAIFAAVAGATTLSVACDGPLSIVAKVFTSLLHVTLCGIAIYALILFSQTPAFSVSFIFFLSLAALLVACELVSTLIPTIRPLLPAILALVSRALLLALAIVTATLLHRRRVAFAARMNSEKGHVTDESCGKTDRVSSPTQATWPFSGPLAFQAKNSPANQSTPPHVLPLSTFPCAHGANQIMYKIDKYMFLPLVLVNAQVFSTLSAGLNVAVSILEKNAVSQSLPHVLLASAACTLVWSFTILAVIQILPVKPRPCYSERQMATGRGRGPLKVGPSTLSPANNIQRTPMASFSRGEPDSMLDFLSLRDPFASSPPPPPPFPPVGLGLEEVDVGWNGSKEISMQYRFPAPRSIIKGGRRKGKAIRGNGKKRLAHQNSSRALLPVPETRGTEERERERGFGDEARLAQLLLQSLNEAASEEDDNPNAPTPVPTVMPPQPAHIQQSSRWSTGTTIQSIVSGSVSNRSGVSTYTTCASEKVPTSRISMNTIASVLGSRKSSEAKRKSGMTASSSKG